jgi:cobalt/nickel transport system permease protein
MGAFIFAAQMLSFPVGIGTSSHLVGGALLATTLGPAAASIVMTAILVTQALIFQDGGVLALGANVFNMAIAGVLAGYVPYVLLKGQRSGVFFGGLLSVVVSAALALGELVSSGVAIPRLALEISAGVFLFCGIIEGAITVAVVSALERIQPGIIREPHPAARRTAAAVAGLAGITAGVAALAASAWPDGIEKLTRSAGMTAGAASFFAAPIADYKLPFTAGTWPGRVAAALIGVALVYLLCVAVSRAFHASKAATKREGA